MHLDMARLLELLAAAGSAFPVWSILSYAARNFPKPTNPYGAWFLDTVQHALANPDKVDGARVSQKEVKDV